jgi:hypothetical protein
MTHFVLVVSGLLALVEPGSSAPASLADTLKAYEAEKSAAGRDSEAQLRLALWCEQHGLNAERIKHLALAVLSDPNNATARGLMGLLAFRGRWETPEAVSAKVKADQELTAKLAEYNARRDKLDELSNEAPSAAKGSTGRHATRHSRQEIAAEHVKLGMWCEQAGLKPEATAHFTQAVVLDPYRDATWKHLGYVKHNGRWLTREKVRAEETEAAEQKRADRYWEPLLEKWKAWLDDPKRIADAEAALDTVIDARAVPTLMRVFAAGAEPIQKAAIKLLGRIDTPAATKALATLAVLSRFDAVRWDAAQALRSREPRDYAGMLVDQIAAPIMYRAQPVGGPGSPGALMVETPRFKMLRTYDAPAVFQPGTNWHGYAGYDANGMPVVASGADLRSLASPLPSTVAAAQERIQTRTQNLIAEANFKAIVSQQRLISDVTTIETTNAQAAALNERITPVLKQTLDAPAQLKDSDEDGWHTWWYDKIGYKYEPPEQIVLTVNASPQYPPPAVTSCFVAGTLVRTLEGRRPIETVRVGDRVLTQDAQDGSLSFQPVMVVHHNAPAETIQVRLDSQETITASTYHRFWRIGGGWAMARELKTGDALRTLNGGARVTSLDPGPVAPVFNLDVAQTRTFFVGEKDALVHDNTLPDPHLTGFDALTRQDKK